MRLSIRQLRYICEVATTGSVLAASSSLGISQSSILSAIALAEAEIKTRIFVRRPARGMFITPTGQRFVSAAHAMLGASIEFDRSVGYLSSRVPRKLRIGCFDAFGVLIIPEALRRYQQNAGEEVEFVVLEGSRDELDQWLSNGMIDLALLYDLGAPIGEHPTPICTVPPHVALHVNDPLATREVISLVELAKRPMVLLEQPQAANYILTIFQVLATRPKISFTASSYAATLGAISAGFGFGVLNMRPIGGATADSPHIVRRPITEHLPQLTLIVADLYGSTKPLFMRIFIDALRSLFQEQGSAGFSVNPPDGWSAEAPLSAALASVRPGS